MSRKADLPTKGVPGCAWGALSLGWLLLACSSPAPPPEDEFVELTEEEGWSSETLGNVTQYHRMDDDTVCSNDLAESVQHMAAVRALLELPASEEPAEIVRIADTPTGDAWFESFCSSPLSGCTVQRRLATKPPSLVHELAHLAVTDLGRPHRLVEEGLAVAVTCRPFNGLIEPDQTDWRTFAEFVRSGGEWPDEEHIITRSYYWAGRWANSLILRFGVDAFVDYYRALDQVRDNDDLATEHEARFGESLDDSWQLSRDPEFAQGCRPVGLCDRDLPASPPDTTCVSPLVGGGLKEGLLHTVEVSGDHGVYACSGRAAETQVPRLQTERALLFSRERIAVGPWFLEETSALRVDSAPPGESDCVDLSVHLGAEVVHFVVMPPFEELVVELSVESDSPDDLLWLDWGSEESLGWDGETLGDDAPVQVSFYESCAMGEQGTERSTWLAGESGLIGLTGDGLARVFELDSYDSVSR